MLDRTSGEATQQERQALDLAAGETVWRFERVRAQAGQPILWERLVLPRSVFADIDEATELPNNVYQYYGARYGIIVARVEEKLKAVGVPSAVAVHLGIAEGSPVLQIDRHAIALDGRVVEWRHSLCRSDMQHYRSSLA